MPSNICYIYTKLLLSDMDPVRFNNLIINVLWGFNATRIKINKYV